MKAWYERAFGERYLRLYEHRDAAEAERALGALFPGHSLAGRRVLDLGCGPGRHLRVLYERGAKAVGVDLSAALLAEARRVFDALRSRADLARADMRQLPFGPATFDLTLSMFTSFGYFERDEEHAALAAEMGRVTRTLIVVDVPDRESLARGLVARTERRVDELRVVETRSLDASPPRVVKRVRLERAADGGFVDEYEERVRLFDADELARLFAPAGFVVEDRLGDYEGSPYSAGRSPRLLLRLRRQRP